MAAALLVIIILSIHC